MKVGIVRFPGSNCDRDVQFSLKKLSIDTIFLWHSDSDISPSIDLVIIPGGFSWGDYLRCGALAARAPIMKAVKKFHASGGYVIGICNGFQILCESGLLPGALRINISKKFICRNIKLLPNPESSPMLSLLKKSPVTYPIAHHEGNYYLPQDQLKELSTKGQIAFKYCDESGDDNSEANPNGSVMNIAGIVSEDARILGLMPHPERAMDELCGMVDGNQFWESVINSLIKK